MAFARLGALLLLWQVGQIKCTEDGPLRWYRLRTTVEVSICVLHRALPLAIDKGQSNE